MMKIVTWNINGYRSITGQNPSTRFGQVTRDNKLQDYIERVQPDILCIQETKADIDQINPELRTPQGYYSVYNSCKIKKGYSGVAVFSKIKPKKESFGFGNEYFDDEGRIIELEFNDFNILNIYFPKGYADNERLDYKLDFYEYLFDYLKSNSDKPYIISGDYNTAHHDIDLARPQQNIGTSGFMPVERVKLDWMVDNGFTDTFRLFNNENGHYTWWSQRGRARENNIGWRIDYHFVSNDLVQFVKAAYHQPEELGSDHCPVVLELK